MDMQRLFEQALTLRKIKYTKSNYTSQFPVYKINLMPKTILDALYDDDAYEMLFSIEPMPQYIVSLDLVQNEILVDAVKPISGHRYETLGILDNGIAPIPHLAPWMLEERWTVYPESEIDQTHGTFVAGVALYGDICEGKDWVGHSGIRLFDATVFPNKRDGIEEDELIANIREAIEANYKKIKVW